MPDILDNTLSGYTLGLNQVHTQNIDWVGDHDWIRVNLVAGQTYRFMMWAGSSLNTYLTLRDSRGYEITHNDNYFGVTDSIIDYTATATGTYYLDARLHGYSMGSYSIYSTTIGDVGRNSFDSSAIQINSNTSSNLNYIGDHDLFSMELVAGQNYQFNLTANTSNLDSFLRLLNRWQGQITYNDDISHNNLNSQISYCASYTGTHYLDASAWRDQSMGAYTLTATNIGDVGDSLSLFATLNESYSPGIGPRGSSTSTIGFSGDHDWFKVELAAVGYTYGFSMEANNSTLDTYLTLRDSNGTEIAANDDSVYGGLNSFIQFTPQRSGTYFLDAGAYSAGLGDINAATGNYNIRYQTWGLDRGQR